MCGVGRRLLAGLAATAVVVAPASACAPSVSTGDPASLPDGDHHPARPDGLQHRARRRDHRGVHCYVRMTGSVKNGTDKRWEPTFTTQASSGENEMDEAFDSAKGLEGSPDMKVLKGKSKKFDIGYCVEKGEDFVLEVAPDYDHEEVLFIS